MYYVPQGSSMTISRVLVFLLVLVCAGLLCLSANQQTLIRTSVHVVEVSVVATGSKGKPVSGR